MRRHLNLIRDNARLYTRVKMPNTNGPAISMAAYINDVQAQLTIDLLSKDDAELTYETKSNAALSSNNTIANISAITSLNVASKNLQSNVNPVAPGGQQDLWQYATSGTVGGLMYYSSDFGYVYNGGTTIAAYSSDGGATFLPVVFDIAPVAAMAFASRAGLVVALTTSAETYTSTDGINFTKGSAAPAGRESFNIDYFISAGLFITGANVDATHQIITSPDGLTWTSRASSISVNTIHSNSTTVVVVGDTTPFVMSSTNGINWANTSSSIAAACQAVAWSEDRKEWLINVTATGRTYVSTNGDAWTNLGVVAPVMNGDSLIWIGGTYNRWYACAADTNNNYSIWTTPDARTVNFVGTHLDGALLNPTNYYIAYISSLNRIVIGNGNAPWISYNTRRPYDIKAVSDNIRVRNSAVGTDKYSGAVDFAIASTVTETTIVPATSIGSLAYQARQPVGMKVKFALVLLNTSGAGDTLTLRFKTQAGTLLTHSITVGAGATNLITRVKGSFIVRAATLSMVTTVNQSGVIGTSVTATPAYNPVILNTFSVTAQWGAALSTCTVTQYNVSTSFINGA